MRTVTSHHDGHGLNESIVITADELSNGGASHKYDCTTADGDSLALIQFQQGPRDEEGSIRGVTEACLLAILIDRIEGFQAGPYRCHENVNLVTMLKAAQRFTKARADERAARKVLGKREA